MNMRAPRYVPFWTHVRFISSRTAVALRREDDQQEPDGSSLLVDVYVTFNRMLATATDDKNQHRRLSCMPQQWISSAKHTYILHLLPPRDDTEFHESHDFVLTPSLAIVDLPCLHVQVS